MHDVEQGMLQQARSCQHIEGVVIAGDIADQSAADMVVMSSEAVHAKIVDANLLAEFVPCPMLLLP